MIEEKLKVQPQLAFVSGVSMARTGRVHRVYIQTQPIYDCTWQWILWCAAAISHEPSRVGKCSC